MMTTFFVKVRLHDGSTRTCWIEVPIVDGESASTIADNVLDALKNKLWLYLTEFEIESIQFIHKTEK